MPQLGSGLDESTGIEQVFASAVEHHNRGNLTTAADLFGQVIKREPMHLGAYLALSLTAHYQKRLPEAGYWLCRALVVRPELAAVLLRMGILTFQTRGLDRAIVWLRRSLAVRSGDETAILEQCGLIYRNVGLWQEAENCFTATIVLDPSCKTSYLNLGNTLVHQGKLMGASTQFRCLALLETEDGDHWRVHGELQLIIGKIDQAAADFRRAIAAPVIRPLFFRRLAEVHRFSEDDADLAAMQRIAGEIERFPLEEQVSLHFALAKALEDIGTPARAFDHLMRGNALKRATITYDEHAVLGEMERIRAAVLPSIVARLSGTGFATESPIFIVGMPRSGSTLVEQILSRHSDVQAGGELNTFRVEVARTFGFDFPDQIGEFDALKLSALGQNYMAAAHGERPPARRYTDKMLDNFRFTGLIHLALPGARIIHMRRGALDTCLSCFSTMFEDSLGYSWDLGELGRYWRAYHALMSHWHSVLPPDILLALDYEMLVDDLEGQARRLINFCGLEWQPDCLEFHKSQRPVRTASWAQVRRPLYRSSVGRWRSFESQLAPLVETLNAW